MGIQAKLESEGRRSSEGEIDGELRELREQLEEQRNLVEMLSCMGRIGAWRVDLESGEIERTDEIFLIHELPVDSDMDLGEALSFYPESVRERLGSATQALIEEGSPFDMELPFVTARGNDRWVRTMGLAVVRDGGPTEIYGYLQDITDQKEAELDSKEKQARLDQVIDWAELGIFDVNLTEERMTINRHAAEMLGLEADQLQLSMDQWSEIVHPDDLERVVDAWTGHAEGEASRFDAEYRLRTASDEWFWIYAQGKLVEPTATDPSIRITGTFIDITERKRAEDERVAMQQQIQHVQKLESLGVLAGGIAHDFNNLLVSILGNAELALFDLPSSSPVCGKLDNIIGSSRRAADLCSQMLAYSGRGKFRLKPVDLSDVVRETAELLHVSISKKAQLLYDLADDLPLVEADSGQIGQVIMNLITNASEAIGDHAGTIALRTGTMDCESGELTAVYLDESLEEGLYAYVEVEDTGAGMSEDVLEKLFDPFFTTKFTGRGLGMAVVLGIIRGHKGAVHVESDVGRGTRFRVLFPVDPNVAEQRRSQRPSQVPGPRTWSGEGRVLVVDDEPGVIAVSTMMLERLGFEADAAEDGQVGVDKFAANPQGYRCVLLDLTMPNMDGEEAYRRIRELNPSVPILICSGYDEVDVAGRFDDELVGFLQKPFRLERFQEALEKASALPD